MCEANAFTSYTTADYTVYLHFNKPFYSLVSTILKETTILFAIEEDQQKLLLYAKK